LIWLILAAGGAALFFGRKEIAEEAKGVIVKHSDSWTSYDALFRDYAVRYCGMIGSEPGWMVLKAVALNESSLGENSRVARGLAVPTDIEGSKSYDGLSWGLMQVTLRTARDMDPTATEAKLNNAEYSIRLAAQYFGRLKKMFKESDPRFLEYVVRSYNSGPGNLQKISRGERPAMSAENIAHNEEYWARFKRNLARVKG
jgi:membrane-bound lytic murein transglycosylase MltF